MLFWAIILLATLLVLMLLLRPWAVRTVTGSDHDRLRISIYQQNLRELDREYERGQLTPEQLGNVRNELELSLLAELERDKELQQTGGHDERRSGRWSAALPAALIIVLAIPIYLVLGNPQLNRLEQFNRTAKELPQDQQLPLDQVIPEMRRHVDRNPEDANAWLLLADMYASTQQNAEAVSAFEKLYRLTGDDPDVMLRYANALILANNGRFSGKPAELAHKVLAVQPQNYTALLFAGMAADEAGNYAESLQYYRKLLPALQGNATLEQTIHSLIARNEQLLRDAGIDPGMTGTTPPVSDIPAVSLQVSVDITDVLADKYSPDDTLFVYAQAIDGPPMPLAVARYKASELPVDVTLDDSMAMMPAMKLSAFAKIRLQARISKTGNAEPEAGDLVGVLEPVDLPAGETLNITIDSIFLKR